MKYLGLDIGDVWVGSAISDALGILSRPLQTVTLPELIPFLQKMCSQERIGTLIIGNPITLKGTESSQTHKVHEQEAILRATFPDLEIILWDERLSSKRADTLKKNISKEDKRLSHSRAAAFILQSYLDYTAFQKNLD